MTNLTKEMVVREGKYIGFKKTCDHCSEEIVSMIEFVDKAHFMGWLNEFNNVVHCTYCHEPSLIT